LANDLGYENSISQQVEMMAEPGDVIVLISSSGNSLNVVKAAETARAKEVSVVGLTGFTGGKLRDLAEISLHVPIANYGIVEDAHQILMHVISQYLSQSTNKKEFVKEMN
jgi:phosphoheptose isomerase